MLIFKAFNSTITAGDIVIIVIIVIVINSHGK